jgi:hypothetical protein
LSDAAELPKSAKAKSGPNDGSATSTSPAKTVVSSLAPQDENCDAEDDPSSGGGAFEDLIEDVKIVNRDGESGFIRKSIFAQDAHELEPQRAPGDESLSADRDDDLGE